MSRKNKLFVQFVFFNLFGKNTTTVKGNADDLLVDGKAIGQKMKAENFERATIECSAVCIFTNMQNKTLT
jgi:hypothetical protein